MGLRMAAPWKHPDSGIYWLRRRVPADLVALVGRREEKLSLRTRDRGEAKAAYIRAAAEVEARWANLRNGTRRVTHKDAVAMAGEFYRQLVAAHEDDPGDPQLVLGRLLADQVTAGSPEASASALRFNDQAAGRAGLPLVRTGTMAPDKTWSVPVGDDVAHLVERESDDGMVSRAMLDATPLGR